MKEYKVYRGKTIKSLKITENPKGQKTIEIQLESGETITFGMESGSGLDSNWYEWLVMRVNGAIAERL